MASPSSTLPASLFRSCRGAFLGVALLSGLVNLLTLSGSVFMLEVYDRVLPSRSIPTLVGLCLVLLLLYAFQGAFDAIRGRILARVGAALDEDLNQPVFRSILHSSVAAPKAAEGQQAIRDLDQLRAFLAGSGPGALFDLPWMPLYLAVCFGFHF